MQYSFDKTDCTIIGYIPIVKPVLGQTLEKMSFELL